VFSPASGTELYSAIRSACALARAGTPGPVMVEVSVDLYLTRHEVSPERWGPSDQPAPPSAGLGQVRRAAAMLAAPGARPLLYAGLGAQGAIAELLELAERLEAPVATTIQGKGVFPESHPLFLWNGLGASAPPFVRAVTSGRNLTLAIGCRFSEVGTGSYGFTPPGPLIHVDINPEVLGRNFAAELAIASDARAFLSARSCSTRSTGASVPRPSSPPTAGTGPFWPWSASGWTGPAASSRRWTTPAWATRYPRRWEPSSAFPMRLWSHWRETAPF
jgi:acetolactate synthase-1/2/3 large subunit